MESDTSDSRDEEVHETADEVEKENQTLTDCPADDQEAFEATKRSQPTKQTRYRWLRKNFISPDTTFSGQDVTSDVSFHILDRGINHVGTSQASMLTQL